MDSEILNYQNSNNDQNQSTQNKDLYLYGVNPFIKLQKYGIIPWKFIVHIGVLIFTVLESIICMNYYTSFLLPIEKEIRSFFFDSNERVIVLSSQNELKTFLSKSLDNYNNIRNLTFDNMQPNEQPSLIISYLNIHNEQPFDEEINLDSFLFFHENNTEFVKRINLIKDFLVDYKFLYKKNFVIKVIQKFDFRSRGYFKVSLSIHQNKINVHKHMIDLSKIKNSNLLTHILVLFFAFWSLFLTWSHLSFISEKYNSYSKVHHSSNNDKFSSSSTSTDSSIYYNPVFDSETTNIIQEKKKKNSAEPKKYKHIAKYVKWSFICLFGNVLQILGSSISIFTSITHTAQILIGLGAFFACLNMVRYIELNKNFSEIYDTLKFSYPNVSRYLISVSPIVFGFLFFGVCVFWENERFSNVSGSILSLFSIMMGDSICDILTELKSLQGVKSFIGLVYGIIFCMVTILIILNLFIQIIDDGYVAVKMRNKSSFVLNYINKPNNSKENGFHNKRKASKSMPKLNDWSNTNLYTGSLKIKSRKGSLVSNKVLTLKNKEMSYGNMQFDDTYEKKSFQLSKSRKELIEFSLKTPQFSIIEKEENSFTSSSLSSNDLPENKNTEKEQKKITENINKVNGYTESINSHFESIGNSFNIIKNLINKNIHKDLLPSQSIIKKLDGIKQSSIKMKKQLNVY